jgi:membrane protein
VKESLAQGKHRAQAAARQVSDQVRALEERPLVGFPIASYRRFKEIDGKQLAFVIGGNMFISVIPLFIVGYAVIEAFNPHRTFATIIIQRFQLTGETADTVRATFTNAQSGRNIALSLSIASLFITGFGVATTVQTAYARAFRVAPLKGAVKFVRGGAWLLLMLTVTALGLTLRYWASGEPWWFLLLMLPFTGTLNFLFFWISPRLLLDLPFGWRPLVPGALVCVLVNAAVGFASALYLRNLLQAYGHAYGGFGIALAFLAWIGILALFWVWIGVIAAIYWERFAGANDVAEIEQASAHLAEG